MRSLRSLRSTGGVSKQNSYVGVADTYNCYRASQSLAPAHLPTMPLRAAHHANRYGYQNLLQFESDEAQGVPEPFAVSK